MQLPLTFQQQWLWGLLQKHNNWNCAVAYPFRLKGALNVPILQRSFKEVTRRHSSLHTRITAQAGVPRQETDDPNAGHLDVAPVPGVSEAEIEAQARRIFVEFAERIVDPAVGPLLRVKLLKLSDSEHWLVMALHRMTADCFSADQIFRELWSLYRGFLNDQASPFPTDPPQYGDYALWQEKTASEWYGRHETYWKGRLAGATNLQWPVDKHPALSTPGTIARMSGWFEDSLSADLQELWRRARTLSATAMLAVYVAVLWRWCGQKDFIVPFNIAGRQAEHKYVIGYFSHILYLRMQLTGRETFTELLSLVSNEFFRALSHQDFGRMAMQEPQLLAGTFFQWITWHPEAAVDMPESASAPELAVERLSIRDFGDGLSALPAGMVDVDITFFDTPKGIYASGVYRADLFTTKTMERFMADLRSAASLFVRSPGAPVAMICGKIDVGAADS